MKVTCPQCAASFNVDASRIPSQGARLRCANCQQLFPAMPPGARALPLPDAETPGCEVPRALWPRDSSQATDVLDLVPLPAPQGSLPGPLAVPKAGEAGAPESARSALDWRTLVPPAPQQQEEEDPCLDDAASGMVDEAAFEALFEASAEEEMAETRASPAPGDGPIPLPAGAVEGSRMPPVEVAPEDAAEVLFDPFESMQRPGAPQAVALPAPADDAIALPDQVSDAIALPDVAPAAVEVVPLGPSASTPAPVAVPLPEPSRVEALAAVVPLPDEAPLDEASLFGPELNPSSGEDGCQAPVLDQAVPVPLAVAAPFAFDETPDAAGEEVIAETGSPAAHVDATASDAQAPLALTPSGEPEALSASADGEDASSTEDVAEAFLKSLSGSVMKDAAAALDSFAGPLADAGNAACLSDTDESQATADMPNGELPAAERAGEAAIAGPAPELGALSGASEITAADASLEQTPGMDGDQLSADALFGMAEAVPPPSESPAPIDFASLLTFNSTGDLSDTAAAAPAAPSAGNLELDLAAVTSPESQDDKLEVLDFIEEKGSPEAPAAPAPTLDGSSYCVRRQSEKPRGPFDTLTIIYMITSGQLLGDEEVSRDQQNWVPINSVRAFAEAIEQLMASPGDVAFAVDSMAERLAHQKDEALERIKARYGDRIADIAIVSSPEEKLKFKPSRRMAIGIAAVLLLLSGAALGLTSYGPFAIHWLFPKEIRAGTPEHRQHLQALEALNAGTWAGSRRALALAEALLDRDPSLIEPRALYAQSAFHLQRIYRTDADKRRKAERYLSELSADDEKASKPELLKAWVALDLLQKNTSRRSALEAHLSAHPEDRAAVFLLSDLLAISGDTPGAVRALDRLLAENAGDVRALRQIGLIRLGEQVPEQAWVEVAIGGALAETADPLEPPSADTAADLLARAPTTQAATAQIAAADQAASAVPEARKALGQDVEAGTSGEGGGRARSVRVSPKVLEALTFFDRAIEADPEDAESILAKADILTQVIPRPKEALALLARLDADALIDRLSPPDRARADFLRGLDLVALRQYGEAFAAFDKAMEAAPENAAIPALYGKLLLNQGDHERAESLFARARAIEPDNLLHLDGQVRSLIGLEKYHQAQSLLTKAQSGNPGSTRLSLLQGRVLDELDRQDEAIASYQRALADEEVGWEAALYMGNIYLERGRFEEAKGAFDQAIAKGQGQAQPHVGLGRYFLATQALAEAFDAFDAAIQIDGDNAAAHFGMADALAAQGQLTEAEKAFERAIAINEKLPGLETRYGVLLWRLGKREAAAAAFEKARSLDFRDVEALWKQGAVYFELKRYDQAFESLSSALAAEPGNVDALFYKARVQYERQETTQAIQTIRSALERKKDRAELHYWAGKIYSQAQKFAEAVAAWGEAIQLDPHYADAIESLAHAYQEQGDFIHAVTFFEKTLKADPKRQALHFNIAECLFSMNRYKDAISEYQSTIDFDSNFKEAYFKIGRSYNEMNQLDQAIKWYNKAIQLDANYSEAWMLLGYAHKEKFRYRQAIKAFEEYLRNATNKKDIETIQTEILDLKALL